MLIFNVKNKQTGFSIVELLVGTVVGLLVITGVMTVYLSAVKSSADTLKAAKLNQELNAAMSLMIRDVRRAGYYEGVSVANLTNPFMVSAGTNPTNLDIKATNGPCVLYTYDRDGAGATANTASEFFGFRLNNNAIEIRTGAGDKTNSCTNGTWAPITDNSVITVSALTFTTEHSKCLNSSSAASPQANWSITSSTSTSFPCRDLTGTGYVLPTTGDVLVETRHITIQVDAELVSDSVVKKSLRESTRIRNDRVTIY